MQARALCPFEIDAIEGCSDGYETCEEERVRLEWCFHQMYSTIQTSPAHLSITFANADNYVVEQDVLL